MDMIEKGQLVVYGSNGVCRVQDVRCESFGLDKKEYYVLNPVHNPLSTIFVPLSNPTLVEKMKPLLTKEQILAMTEPSLSREDLWIEAPTLRKDRFKAVLESGDRQALLNLICTLFRKREQRERQGKKLWNFDNHALDTAQRLLQVEFGLVLGMTQEEAAQFLLERLGFVLPA